MPIIENYWDEKSWMESSHPIAGEKWIYFVAGLRNVSSAVIHGGLWANVGETSKSIEERLEGLDYKRKAAGGEWIILNKWRVPDWISDKMIHEKLRVNPGVKWTPSSNTEEFLFLHDNGDGNTGSNYIRAAIMEVVMEESRKTIAGIKSERDSLREKLKRLQDEKSRKDFDAGKRLPEPSLDWKFKVSEELLWRKEVKDSIAEISEPPSPKEAAREIAFSYLFGLGSILAYLFFEPTILEFILLFLPVSSALSTGIGLFRSWKKWKSRLDRIKEKI